MTNLIKIICAILPLLIVTASQTVMASSLTPDVRGKLFLAVNSHIGKNTTNSGFQFLNVGDGKFDSLKFQKMHQVVFEMESRYMLCADFVNTENGEKVLIDFIVAKHIGEFIVTESLRGKRHLLTRLFSRVF